MKYFWLIVVLLNSRQLESCTLYTSVPNKVQVTKQYHCWRFFNHVFLWNRLHYLAIFPWTTKWWKLYFWFYLTCSEIFYLSIFTLLSTSDLFSYRCQHLGIRSKRHPWDSQRSSKFIYLFNARTIMELQEYCNWLKYNIIEKSYKNKIIINVAYWESDWKWPTSTFIYKTKNTRKAQMEEENRNSTHTYLYTFQLWK